MDIIIRKATTADIPAIHKLVQELAVYEREPEAVITTPDIYLRDFNEGVFDALVAESGNIIIGMALYYTAYSTWKGKYLWLEDFVVQDNYRGKGTGVQLFEAVIAIAKKQNAFFKWQVLDWNEPAINFYKKYNAEFLDHWITCRMEMKSDICRVESQK